MTDFEHVILFLPAEDIIPIEELFELTGLENVSLIEDAAGQFAEYRIEWADVSLRVSALDSGSQATALKDFMQGVDELLLGRKDKKAQKVWRRTERMVLALQCEVRPTWDKERKAQHLLQGIMEFYDYAFMWVNGTLYNENGNLEVGHEQSKAKYWQQEQVIEEEGVVLERKKRSIEQLKLEKIPFIPHLPILVLDEECRLRPLEEVVQRAIALNLVSRFADGADRAWFEERVAYYQIQAAITAEEWEFVRKPDPLDYIIIKFSRRMESYWLLLWALGYVKQLHLPEEFCPVEFANQIIDSRTYEQFLAEAVLRPQDELLDMADLYYRYHWALVDAELYGRKAPHGLEQPVVYERHYALNWLIGYKEQVWDLVTTDT